MLWQISLMFVAGSVNLLYGTFRLCMGEWPAFFIGMLQLGVAVWCWMGFFSIFRQYWRQNVEKE